MTVDLRLAGKWTADWSDLKPLLDELDRLARAQTVEVLESLARVRLVRAALDGLVGVIAEAEADLVACDEAYKAAVGEREAVAVELEAAEARLVDEMSLDRTVTKAKIRSAIGAGRKESLMPLEAKVSRAKEAYRLVSVRLGNLRRCVAALEEIGEPDVAVLKDILAELA